VSTGSVEAPDSGDEVNSVASRAQVARILESSHFAKAERLKRFLRFVTEETLNGLSIEIKESVVGVEVFDRDAATYDPRTDPIVRVQASRVRAKLADYYANEGANDRVLVELPRGQYVPLFSLRSTASAGALGAPPNGMPPPTRSVVALNQYLMGRFHWNKRDEAGFRAGLAHFHKAIQIDPHHGRAFAGIADCNIMLAMSGAEAPAACMPLAERAALRALEIDNRLVEAHTSLGAVRAGFHWDWQGSETEFQRRLESDPSYATLHHWYSIYLLAPLSRFDQAKMEITLAEQLDPASLTINLGRAQTLYLAGECLSAIAQCTKVLRLDERYYRAYWWMGLAHSRLGNFESATEALETARARAGADTSFRARILGALGHTYGRSGRADRASAVLDELAAISQSNYVDQFEIAHVLAGLGRSDAALDNLERAAEDRSGWLSYCGVWSAFESLRPNPRFQALLKGMRLRRSGNGST
jgi:tetratricopeptide (TPR) repeat protein